MKAFARAMDHNAIRVNRWDSAPRKSVHGVKGCRDGAVVATGRIGFGRQKPGLVVPVGLGDATAGSESS